MPSLISLLRRSGKKSERQDHEGKGLKRRSNLLDLLRGRSQREVLPTTEILPVSNPHSTTLSPMLAAFDSNKPLPPPPKVRVGPETEKEKPPKKAPVKLERIISPLTEEEIRKLFSGAPRFQVLSEDADSEAPIPNVDFPWRDEELEIQNLIDHKQIEHVAWNCSSTYARTQRETRFLTKVKEKPNVLSLQGLENGTIGFAAALESQISDAVHNGADLGSDPNNDLSAIRTQFFAEDGMVRPLDELRLIEWLSEIGEYYYDDQRQRPSDVELYSALFTRTLFPPTRVTDPEDPYSLAVQIDELLNVLSSTAFIDFSVVEMRIRLGQILWNFPDSEDEDDIAVEGDFEDGQIQQKNWLLLQILLCCELLMRLDFAVQNAGDSGTAPAEIQLVNQRANPATKWGLLLARSWLDNIKVKIPDENEPVHEKTAGGWFSSFRGKGGEEDNLESLLMRRTTFEYRHADEQLSGLLLFARKIKWDNIEGLASRCLKNKEDLHSIPKANMSSKPSGTPSSIATRRSYFSVSKRPSLRRNISTQQRIYAVIHPAGWLSCSYLSGVVLPGEPMSHLLMATLLENDGEAMGLLGEETTLYGGFIYAQRSYWSLFCIVGRILAAAVDSSECMGWVSSKITPEELSDRWVDIEVQDVSETSSQARIWQREAIERDSRVTGDGDLVSTFSSDFIVPQDLPPNDTLDIRSPKLMLSSRAESTLTTPTISTPGLSEYSEPPSIQNSTARMIFDVKFDEPGNDDGENEVSSSGDWFAVTFFLIYDVQFVTANPCIAPNNSSSILSPALSPPAVPKLHCEPKGHPLHKSYIYSHQPLSWIGKGEMKPFDKDAVLIIDCACQVSKGAPDISISNHTSNLDMLARAYCSENGFNALISRKGRSCLSCSIREARALDFRVIIRVGNDGVTE